MDEGSWKVIVELRRTPNITRAAERLFMSQPTLSKKLQSIESDLGIRLVVRTSKGVAFTPEGEYVAAEAAKVLGHFSDIRANLLRLGDGRSGAIRIGMTNSFALHTLPRCLKRYSVDYPGVEFDISTDISAHVVERLENDDIHVGFVRGDMEGNFERTLIDTEQACLVNRDKVELAALPGLPQISYLSDPFAKRLLDGWWHSHFSRPPLIGMRANHGDTCLEMIASGLGYGIFLSPNFVGRSRGLFQTPLYYADGSPFGRNAWMIWRAEFARIPLIGNFLAYMQGEIAGGLLTAGEHEPLPAVPG